MSSNFVELDGPSNHGPPQSRWHELAERLEALVRFAEEQPSRADFYHRLLDVGGTASGAAAGTVWLSRSANRLAQAAITTRSAVREMPGDWEPVANWFVDRRRQQVVESRCWGDRQAAFARQLAMGTEIPVPTTAIAEGNWWSVTTPIRIDGQATAALEFLWPAPVVAERHDQLVNLMQALAESARTFEQRGLLLDFRRQVQVNRNLDDCAARLQAVTSESAACFTLANEVGSVIDCDRVTILLNERTWRVGAISHVDGVDRRSPLVNRAERLAAAVAVDGQITWHQQSSDVGRQSADEPWQAYWEESASRSAALIPLIDSRTPAGLADTRSVVGAILVERFAENPFAIWEQIAIERLARHASAVLVRIRETSPYSPATWLRRRSTVLAVLISVGMAIACLIPVDLEITATGEAQPLLRRHVFAPGDGLIQKIRVREGDLVKAHDVLFEMSDDELEFERTRLSGELRTARQQLASLQASRLDRTNASRDPRVPLAAEEERIKQVVHSLEQQHTFVLSRREQLSVRSPIAGRVVTANLERSLQSRPVRRGQQLLTVAADDGTWILEVRVRGADAGHVLAAHHTGATLPVHFKLATEPEETRQATVHDVSRWTEFDRAGEPGIRVTARIESVVGVTVQPGATAQARIGCGRGRLGYVWFRDLIELVRTQLFF